MRAIILSLMLTGISIAGPPTGYSLVFSSKFDTPNYVPIAAQWNQIPPYHIGQAWVPEFLGHTPNAQDFGDAYFTTPYDSQPSPWWMGWGQLICSPYIDSTGHWRSGIISTADTRGGGTTFTAPFYIEASFTVPATPGIWPSFWLNDTMVIPYLGRQNAGTHYEIDVMECYGYNPVAVNQHVHVWAPYNRGQVGGADNIYQAPHKWTGTTTNSFQSGSHTYGLLVTSAAITFYMDNVQTFTCAAPADITSHSFFAMVDYALGAGYADPAPPLAPMWIQYIRGYKPL